MSARKIRPRHIAAASLCAFGLACLETSAAQKTPSARPPGDYLFSDGLVAGFKEEFFLSGARSVFVEFDANADGLLTAADIDLHDMVREAKYRLEFAQNIMQYDFDGDGLVAEDELRFGMRYERRRQFAAEVPLGQASPALHAAAEIEEEVSRLRVADADKDGKLSYGEAQKAGPRQGIGSDTYLRNRVLRAMALAPRGADITMSAYVAAARDVFRVADFDRDGELSQGEVTAYQKRFARVDTGDFAKESEDLLERVGKAAESRSATADIPRSGKP